MLSELNVKLFKIQLSISSKIFTVPYEWQNADSNNVKFTSARDQNWRLRFRFLTMAYLVSLALNAIKTIGIEKHFSAFPTAVGFMWLTIVIGTFHFLLLGLRKEQEILTLLNSLFKVTQYDSNFQITSECGKKNIMDFILGFGIILSLSFGPFVGCLLSVLPCLPPFLGSLIFECDSNGFILGRVGVEQILFVLGQSVLNALIWTYSIIMCVFYMFCVFPMSVVSIAGQLNQMQRLCKKSSSTANQAVNTKVFRMYRESQILTCRLNDCYQHEWLPMTTLVAAIVEIISLYVCIAKWDELPMLAFLFFPLAMSDVAILLFGMLGLASKLYIKSQEVTRSLKKCSGQTLLFKRVLRSLAPLKVGFGSTNFVDETSPLVINRFCISQAASMILLDR